MSSTQHIQNLVDRILSHVSQASYRPAKQHEIARDLRMASEDRSLLRKALKELERKGELVCLRKNRWARPDADHDVTGRLRVNPKGFGILEIEGEQGETLYIPSDAMGNAMDGDRVMARRTTRPYPTRSKRKTDAKIVRVLERKHRTITGLLKRPAHYDYVIPDHPNLLQDIRVDAYEPSIEERCKDGHKVVIELMDPETSADAWVRGRVIEHLGPMDAPGVDMLCILKTHQVRMAFDPKALEEADRISATLTDDDLMDRTDCRAQCAFTIDPEDAKDYDDAIAIEKNKDGWTLWVHIADVGHYVQPGTALDREAATRGNSVYLVDRVVPMLPPRLTKEICSLTPNADKLTFTAEIEISAQGEIENARWYPSVIHSKACLSYDEVQAFLDGRKALKNHSAEVREGLRLLRLCAQAMRSRRIRDGSLDFALPEIRCRLDENGRPVELIKRQAMESYQLIEDCMLAANRVVARDLAGAGTPAVYRIHEPPEDEQWAQIAEQLATLGFDLPVEGPAGMNALAAKLKDDPRGYVVTLTMLRGMKRAMYSEKLAPHFGLGFDRYTHFTSPIRRYADLLVHRLLRGHSKGQPPYSNKELAQHAAHCTDTEWEADKAESESLDWKRLEYYRDLLWNGETGPHQGLITAVLSRGLIVELNDTLLRGLAPFATLRNDHYNVDPSGMKAEGSRGGKSWMVGMSVTVEVVSVDMARRMVDFRLVDARASKRKTAQKKGRLDSKPKGKASYGRRKRTKRKRR